MQAVLAAVNHNAPAADLLLREMEQHQAPSGSDSDEDSASHLLPAENLTAQPAAEEPALVPSLTSSPPISKAPAPPTSRRGGSSTKCKPRVDRETAQEDLYYKYRREALKLSKAWHKRLHQAANAFAAAHYSGDCFACARTLQNGSFHEVN